MPQGQKLKRLEREVRDLRSFVARLTRALYTHTRTDIAPDAALPAMRKMVAEISAKKPRAARR